MFQELQCVRARSALPEHGIEAGALGAVVHVFTRPQRAYEVEFCDDQGETIAMVPLKADQLVAA